MKRFFHLLALSVALGIALWVYTDVIPQVYAGDPRPHCPDDTRSLSHSVWNLDSNEMKCFYRSLPRKRG